MARQLLVLLAGLSWLAACATRPPAANADLSALLNDPDAVAADAEIGYICPMHPEETSDAPGRCPRCGMALVQAPLFEMRDYDLHMRVEPPLPKPGDTVTLTFNVFDPATTQAVRTFELVHDRPYHLFVISQDMEFFQHLHPQQAEDGTWTIDTVLPKPGYYQVLSDFTPTRGSAQFLVRPIVTAGYDGDLLAQSAHLEPDTSRTQTVDDLTATITFDPDTFWAGSYGHLTFHLAKAGTNEPVKDLQTYLGAFGHMLIMSEDMIDHVHSHPAEILPQNAVLETLRGGPDVMFEGLMPRPGRYRAWTQFRYRDKVHTFVNTFEVFEVGLRSAR